MFTLDLNHSHDFHRMLTAAVALGIQHAGQGWPRLKQPAVLDALRHSFGCSINARNFHATLLNNAYGLAFINRAKMAYVRKAESKS